MKSKIVIIALAVIVVLLLIGRLCVFDVVSVPTTSKCPKTGKMVLVNRWSYGYRLPWKANSRISYDKAKRSNWVAYNRPIESREEEADTTAICIGKIAATSGDTIWYNNDTGRISSTIDTKNGFTHPLRVPLRGKSIQITDENIQFYAITIMRHEPVKASVINGKLCVSGRIVQTYNFQQDYYWIVTGNPKDVADSRSFGFVPHASLIGRID